MIIKVCGMRDGRNISDVVAAGANWIGMIFYPKSPRYVAMIPSFAGILPDKAVNGTVDSNVTAKRVGVFVDDMAQNIITRVVNYKLDMVQLHGQETPTFIRNLRATIDPDIHAGLKFIKAISVSKADDLALCDQYDGVADYLLFDTRCDTMGGSGRQFDWSVLENYHGKTPFLLSGGIGPGDAKAVKTVNHPLMIGIDLNSRFESAPAVKNVEMIRTFINQIKDKA